MTEPTGTRGLTYRDLAVCQGALKVAISVGEKAAPSIPSRQKTQHQRALFLLDDVLEVVDGHLDSLEHEKQEEPLEHDEALGRGFVANMRTVDDLAKVYKP